MTDAEIATKVIHELEAELVALDKRKLALDEARQRIAYAAHTGDKKAKQELTNNNAQTIALINDQDAIGLALIEANRRLGAAKAAEAAASDREREKRIAALIPKLKEALDNVSDAYEDAHGSRRDAHAIFQELRALGAPVPSDQMIRINAVVCIKTHIQELPSPYINDFEFSRLAPSQKKTFRQWGAQIIAHLLPKKENKAA
jgi:hypothetical protein